GWYAGYVGYGLLVGYGPNHCGRYFYGKTPALRVQLELEYDDGSRDVIVTGPDWKFSTGAYREADMIMGETYDARLEPRGWADFDFDDRAWQPAIPASDNGSLKARFFDQAGPREVELGFEPPPVMQAHPGEPVRPTQELRPIRVTSLDQGRYLFDMGQNFAGVVRLRSTGPAGTKIVLRYGEMLHPDGRLMTENLRRARATDTWILRGEPDGEVFEPRFTYHGFQYVEVTGYPGTATEESLVGIAVHSDTPMTSSFECSDPVLNRFYRNVTWTQRANFFEIPTDCPQRDERLGWMGDAQIYVRAATYNADVGAFFTKWIQDVREAQTPEGAYPDYCPYPMQHGGSGKPYATAWMDAGIICPWTIYQVYGDRRILEDHYASMKRFLDFRRRIDADLQGTKPGNGWGDWLSLGEQTPIEYVDHVYFAHSTSLMAQTAEVLGRQEDAAEYRRLLARIRKNFVDRYVQPDGTLAVDTQTAYVLAIAMGLIPEDLRRAAGERLAAKIRENDNRMTTGFLGTRPLLPVLTETGHFELAARMLQSRRFPSWGYEVVNGATSVWERWNSYTKEQGFMNPSMNSFSHYAFGAVCEWMFDTLAGID
ncbi:MAG: family 78 glycoside hydrolase catalytic domain, partial [Planctomycetes bacterium]|nr:family 78 glycoside hydrolase catalytic domain [Planctomycetota bacterium]